MKPGDSKLLALLVGGRVDPRRGVNRWLGTVRVYVIPLYLAAFSIAMLIEKVTGSSGAAYAKALIAWSSIAALGMCWLIPWSIRRRTRVRCNHHGGFLCPWCRYALTGLRDEGSCPECGKRYRREVCERLYGHVYGPDALAGDALERADRKAWSAAIRMQHCTSDD